MKYSKDCEILSTRNTISFDFSADDPVSTNDYLTTIRSTFCKNVLRSIHSSDIFAVIDLQNHHSKLSSFYYSHFISVCFFEWSTFMHLQRLHSSCKNFTVNFCIYQMIGLCSLFCQTVHHYIFLCQRCKNF